MEITRNNLLSLIQNGVKRDGLSIAGLEKKAGVPKDTVRDFLRGKTQILRADKLQKILSILEPQHQVTVSGYIRSGAEIVFGGDEKHAADKVDCPPGMDPSDVIAIRIKSDSMLPLFHNGWVLYFSRQPGVNIPTLSGGWQVPYNKTDKNNREPFAEFTGKPCIVGIAGRAFLGTLKQTKTGYDLVNHNATDMRNIKPEWAAKIIFIKTE